ncbi:MAG: sorbosone dehydrogenase family protein [Burkholderiaceae bacterium]|jgi:glucose/arabinose dehydrogenase|nr:sorbosone dehydrogenase family protein [Burkholderiaceae bacterium]
MRAARLLAFAATLVGCGEMATLPFDAGVGPHPRLPEPSPTLIPTIAVAKAVGWPQGASPQPASGLAVTRLAEGLDHPRWLYVLPNGDVLVAETNAPPKPQDEVGIRSFVMKKLMQWAGSAGPSANRITLLRDADGDGVAEVRETFLSGLRSPFGMALVGTRLYVANTDAIVHYPYVDGAKRIDAAPQISAALPAGPINHHWTKNIVASRDGSKLYASIGSNSNVAENGLGAEEGRAEIREIDLASGASRSYATGLRNPNGMDFEPQTGLLWTVVNERDEIGSDLVPDFLTSVRRGGFYGWPWSWFGTHVDERVEPQRPDLVARAIVPDYALGAHVAALGLVFARDDALPAPFRHGAFIGEHGSWNRRPPSGYKVVFVPFRDGRPAGMPIDVLTGFLNEAGQAQGRPVGVAIDRTGALLVADDVGGVVWRVAAVRDGEHGKAGSAPGGLPMSAR